MGGSLRNAFFWSAVENLGLQAIQFVISVTLARLLSPQDFGLVGMLAIFLAIATIFSDAGLSLALVQRKEISRDDETSVFLLNVAAAFAFVLLLWALSPAVASFYRQPILKPMLRVSALATVVASAGMVHSTLLNRQLAFRRSALISAPSAVIAGSVGIFMAWRGYGVWSLIGQGLALEISRTTLLWVSLTWRPVGRFCWSSIRAMWGYSSKLLASSLLNSTFENIYPAVIGRFYPPAAVGDFTRANGLQWLPVRTTMGIVMRVTFPVLARLQHDHELMKAALRKMIRVVAAGFFPVMTGLSAAAWALVTALLTPKWHGCVRYLQVLCFAGLLYPLHSFHLNVLMAGGRSDLFLRLEVIKKLLVVVMLVVTTPLGVYAMTWGILGISLLCYYINTHYTRKILGYTFREQAADTVPYLLISVSSGAAAWSASLASVAGPWARLAVQALAGAGVYALGVAIFRRSLYADVLRVAREMLAKYVGRRSA